MSKVKKIRQISDVSEFLLINLSADHLQDDPHKKEKVIVDFLIKNDHLFQHNIKDQKEAVEKGVWWSEVDQNVLSMLYDNPQVCSPRRQSKETQALRRQATEMILDYIDHMDMDVTSPMLRGLLLHPYWGIEYRQFKAQQPQNMSHDYRRTAVTYAKKNKAGVMESVKKMMLSAPIEAQSAHQYYKNWLTDTLTTLSVDGSKMISLIQGLPCYEQRDWILSLPNKEHKNLTYMLHAILLHYFLSEVQEMRRKEQRAPGVQQQSTLFEQLSPSLLKQVNTHQLSDDNHHWREDPLSTQVYLIMDSKRKDIIKSHPEILNGVAFYGLNWDAVFPYQNLSDFLLFSSSEYAWSRSVSSFKEQLLKNIIQAVVWLAEKDPNVVMDCVKHQFQIILNDPESRMSYLGDLEKNVMMSLHAHLTSGVERQMIHGHISQEERVSHERASRKL